MKFIHIADVHLGAVPDKGYPWSERRGREIWQTFERVIRAAEREQADLLLIAGDLFHREPLLRELKELNYLFGSLSRTYVVFIAGNHDALRKDAPIRSFRWEENVVFLDGPQCESVFFRDIQTTVYGFSYYSREITEALCDGLRPNGSAGCHILLAHGGDEHHIPMDKNRLAGAGFDYVALGHIHKPQELAPHRMAYAGALEPIDSNDTGSHGYILGEYTEKTGVRTKFVPFAAREYVHLCIDSTAGSTDLSVRAKLREAIAARGAEHIYKVRLQGLRDPEIVYHPETYRDLGNLLEILDETEPDYDFEALLRAHGDDAVGRYIARLLPENGGDHPIKRQALYYGVRALLRKNR